MTKDEQILQLSEELQLSKALAKRIVDAIYEKGLDAKSFETILYRLRRLVEKEQIPKLMEEATDEMLGTLIDEMVAARAGYPEVACCSEMAFVSDLSLSEGKKYAAGDMIDVQILRTGAWNHPAFGKFEVTSKTLSEMVKNYKAGIRRVKLFADEDHDPQHKALAEFVDVFKKGAGELWAKMKLTARGAQLLSDGAYHYFSSEFVRNYTDMETGTKASNLLLGGAFTNRPVVQGMQPILASESGASSEVALDEQVSADPSAVLFLSTPPMLKFLDHVNSFVGRDTITASERAAFDKAWDELPADQKELPKFKKAHADVVALKLSEEGENKNEEKKDETEVEAGAPEGEAPAAPTPAPEAPAAPEEQKPEEEKPVAASEATIEALEAKPVEELSLSEAQILLGATRTKKADLSKRERSILLSEAEGNVSKIFESELGVVLAPASKKKIAEFAVSLSEVNRNTLMDVLKDIQVVMLSELGYNALEGEGVVLSENHPSVKQFQKMGYELSEAMEMAAEHHGIKLPAKKDEPAKA